MIDERQYSYTIIIIIQYSSLFLFTLKNKSFLTSILLKP